MGVLPGPGLAIGAVLLGCGMAVLRRVLGCAMLLRAGGAPGKEGKFRQNGTSAKYAPGIGGWRGACADLPSCGMAGWRLIPWISWYGMRAVPELRETAQNMFVFIGELRLNVRFCVF